MTPDTLQAAVLWFVQAAEAVPLPVQWLLSSLTGASVIGLAMEGWLRRRFPTREEVEKDLSGIGEKVEGVKTVALQALDEAGKNDDRIRALLERSKTHDERHEGQVMNEIGRLRDRVDNLASETAANTEAVKGLGKSLDNLREDRR